jgi:tellurite resistance protein TehA-like permease
MLTDFAFLACGSPFKGADGAYLFGALISLLIGAILAIVNLVLLSILELRRRPTSWHLLAWIAYVGAGALIVIRFFSNDFLTLAGTALVLMALSVIIAFHLVYLIETLRRSRKLPPAD